VLDVSRIGDGTEVKIFLGGLALALLLFASAAPGEAAQEQVPVTAPSEVGQLDTFAPENTGVPLSISETTPPPGWVHPDDRMPEQVALDLLGEAWDVTKWGLGGALVALAILAALVVAFEKSRYQ
jgi:hypothetical protein